MKLVFCNLLNLTDKGYRSFMDVIKNYLKKYFMIYEKEGETNLILQSLPFDYVLKNSDLIIQIFTKFDRNFLTDFVVYIFKTIIEREGSYIVKYEKFEIFDYKIIFFENLHKFFTLPKQILNKFILASFFNLFHENVEYLKFPNFGEILISQTKTENEEFFNLFILNFAKFELCLHKLENWRILIKILKSLEK
jgi:hypothetical protein